MVLVDGERPRDPQSLERPAGARCALVERVGRGDVAGVDPVGSTAEAVPGR
ncbi:hypothetical protein ACFQMM_19060 [Saliphagus sp. GCM10025308]